MQTSSKRPFSGNSHELSRKVKHTTLTLPTFFFLLSPSFISFSLYIYQPFLNTPSKMATLPRPPSKDKDIIGRFMLHARCKKHPKHRQSPGVCSLCLRDKLSQLSSDSPSSSSSRKTNSISSSPSSSVSSYSSSPSSSASPTALPFPFSNEPRTASIFLFTAKHAGFLKSKSMTVLSTRRRRRRNEGEAYDDPGMNKTGKKSGFWSKLLHPKSKRMEEIKSTNLVHTTSLIQTLA
ncbi:uncharacterized serine-rich protein C215.13 [Vigna radiata var. radiata]|uniref:Uncharacterized serine-rich protein C215.13 n=1 Tax=Vigna radiata var. radiata TaxID=3916 RepID=A0A1S3U3I6_VIGRR|nr:uncharacterized serine-rich protein C215.13 [Vigna radiata var. radiata]